MQRTMCTQSRSIGVGVGLMLITILEGGCSSRSTASFFLYDVATWTADEQAGQAVHRHFVDDVSRDGIPSGHEPRGWQHFMTQAEKGDGTVQWLAFDSAYVKSADLELTWSDYWAQEFELWAITESGLEVQLARAELPEGPAPSMGFAATVLPVGDLRDADDDFIAGEFDLELRTVPVVEIDALPELDLLISFEIESRTFGP